MNKGPANSFWQIGKLAPAILVLAMIADAGLRFVPLHQLAFRAWEAARTPFENTGNPFEPDFHYHNRRAYGDLANLGNRPDLREFHDETFTSDRFGFRNPPEFDHPPCAILAGSSFCLRAQFAQVLQPCRD